MSEIKLKEHSHVRLPPDIQRMRARAEEEGICWTRLNITALRKELIRRGYAKKKDLEAA